MIARNLLGLIFVMYFLSCNHNPNDDISNNKRIIITLENSRKTIHFGSLEIMRSLEKKLMDPQTAERAKIWFPRAKKVSHLSLELFNYIDSLKNSIKDGITTENCKSLQEALSLYGSTLLSIDSEMTSVFGAYVRQTFSDSSKVSTKSLSEASAIYATLTIEAIQNDIMITENKLLAFCNAKVPEIETGIRI